jgi:hypothetical protein
VTGGCDVEWADYDAFVGVGNGLIPMRGSGSASLFGNEFILPRRLSAVVMVSWWRDEIAFFL